MAHTIGKGFWLCVWLLCVSLVSARAELPREAMASIGRFLVMDRLTADSPKHREPLTDVFYAKETGDVGRIGEEEIARLGLEFLPSAGEYRSIIIINEVSGLGVLARSASINEHNQVLWHSETSSLTRFEFTPSFGNLGRGVTPLMKYRDAGAIADIFRGCQRGEIPTDWKPTKADLDFYTGTIYFSYRMMMAAP